jgi:hypothetical protein
MLRGVVQCRHGACIFPGTAQAFVPAAVSFRSVDFARAGGGGGGKAQFYLCHGDKLLQRRTLQRRRLDMSYQEWQRG